jgi:hypothetical protein
LIFENLKREKEIDMSQDIQTKQIEINITIDDLIAFNRYAAQRSSQVKRGYRVTLFTVPVALLLIAVLLYEYVPFIVPVESVFILLWFFAFPRLYWRLMDNSVKRMLNERQNKGIVGKHLIEINEKGLHETTEVNDSHVEWAGFDCIEKNEQYIFAFISAMMAHIIPIRAFADTNQATEFYSSMKEYFDQAKTK